MNLKERALLKSIYIRALTRTYGRYDDVNNTSCLLRKNLLRHRFATATPNMGAAAEAIQ